MASYFSYFPSFNYVSRTSTRASNDEYIAVKNIFKRPKLRGDLKNVFTAFADYVIAEDMRPDEVSSSIYGDPRYDWVVLIANDITNYRSQWPLNSTSFEKYILEKYGSYEALEEIHHYETKLFRDEYERLVLPPGLKVDSNFTMKYLQTTPSRTYEVDYGVVDSQTNFTTDNAGTVRDVNGKILQNTEVIGVTNYQYEVNINDGKRRIKVVKAEFLDTIISDMRRIMTYKKSTQFISNYLKQAYNPRLGGS
jgi:hypothetical protein